MSARWDAAVASLIEATDATFGVALTITPVSGSAMALTGLLDGPTVREEEDQHGEWHRFTEYLFNVSTATLTADPMNGAATIAGAAFKCVAVTSPSDEAARSLVLQRDEIVKTGKRDR